MIYRVYKVRPNGTRRFIRHSWCQPQANYHGYYKFKYKKTAFGRLLHAIFWPTAYPLPNPF